MSHFKSMLFDNKILNMYNFTFQEKQDADLQFQGMNMCILMR